MITCFHNSLTDFASSLSTFLENTVTCLLKAGFILSLHREIRLCICMKNKIITEKSENKIEGNPLPNNCKYTFENIKMTRVLFFTPALVVLTTHSLITY